MTLRRARKPHRPNGPSDPQRHLDCLRVITPRLETSLEVPPWTPLRWPFIAEPWQAAMCAQKWTGGVVALG